MESNNFPDSLSDSRSLQQCVRGPVEAFLITIQQWWNYPRKLCFHIKCLKVAGRTKLELEVAKSLMISFVKEFNYLIIYLFLAALGLCCSVRASHCSVFSCWGAQAIGTRALEHSCSAACGIFPDQGSNLCPLHWQVDS